MIRVILNGCFDLFHEGHQYILTKALEFGERGHILVLINTDESTQRLKGEGRPIQSLAQRTKQIKTFQVAWSQARLEYPRITIQPFDTEDDLAYHIDTFCPSVIIKGNDRPDVRTIVGHEKWPIMIVPRMRSDDGIDISTSRLASRLDKT